MNVITTNFEGVFILEPKIFKDTRGYFYESYNYDVLSKHGINNVFVQDNQSCSVYGVVRGLHYQRQPYAQAKLVRVLEGKILDVIVDLRENSRTFGKYFSAELSAENHKQLLVPAGFAHGFSVLSERAVFAYKCDNYYNKASECTLAFDDKSLNIDWQIPLDKILVSDKDKLGKSFSEVIKFT